MSAGVLATLGVRYLLVMLFFPFSALDKLLNFEGAVGQARQVFSPTVATAMIVIGVGVEILMPLGILTGVSDRAAALVLAGYCGVTAMLFKQFWTPGDFWHRGDSQARTLFWDFLKNFSLAGGFLLVTIGTTAPEFAAFLRDPLASSHPYTQARP